MVRLLMALSLVLSSTPAAGKDWLSGPCRIGPGLGLLLSPAHPTSTSPLRVIGVSMKPHPGATLVGRGPGGPHALKLTSGGGPPYWWLAQIARPAVGRHRFALLDAQGAILACRSGRTERRWPDPPLPDDVQWRVKRSWNQVTEALFSAWIENLFDAPPRSQPSWTPLHQVIRDPRRNILYDHLGADEDGPDLRRAVVVEPDCADLPYFLRAYFAWKLRLPFGHRHCDRGSSTRPSRCGELRTNLGIPPIKGTAAKRFSNFLRRHVSLVHSGAGRTAPDDNETDLYPVRLRRRDLRPGTVYVDPYGHLLVVARWVAPANHQGGLLYAVDGHPDLSVGRKRFWQGAFLFSDQIQGGAGGFKAFRPLVLRQDKIEALTNVEIHKHPHYGNHSSEQYRLGIDGFYDRMDELITPQPLSPTVAYRERLDALYELVLERVGSVKVGEEYMARGGYKVIPMPTGPRIFETSGPWEDFSTPARDLRLLIAMEEIARYPRKVLKQPRRFALAAGQSPGQARTQMEQLFQSYTAEKKFSYTRSDGSTQTLTMAQLLQRRSQLEVAYNPNDCVEIRWGATSNELQSCKRRAPADQQQRMAKYRTWFATRTRPPLR